MPAAGHGKQPIDFTNARDLATVFFKHKNLILVTFLVIFAGVTIFGFQIPRPYEAKTVLLVKYGREFQQRPEEPKSGGSPSIPPAAVISGEMRILTSRDVLTKVAQGMGPEILYPDLSSILKEEGSRRMQAAVAKLEGGLNATNVAGSNLIELTLTHKDPAIAAKALNLLVDAFKEKHLEVFSGAGTPFLENQLKESHAKLTAAEKDLGSFGQKYGVFSFEEQRSNLISQRSTIDAKLRDGQNQMSELQQKATWTRSPAWTPPSAIEMRAPIVTLEQKERELLEKFTPGSRAVQNVRQEIEITKASLQKNSEELRQAELRRIEGDMGIVKARTASLTSQARELDRDIQSLDTHGRVVQDLKRQVVEQERSYQAYTQKLDESLIMDDMDRRKMAAISVIETAAPASTRKKQRFSPGQMAAAGFAGGIVGGLFLALLVELMASSMTLPHSAERRLGLPVMVAITRKKLAAGW